MRVIAGKHRGTLLFEFKGKDIRPTSDRAKESLFNILRDVVAGADCLDLFCGTGSLGIEALSRGARSVDFVDISPESVSITRKNLQKVKENSAVFTSDAIAFLSSAKRAYDIIFIDPPYADDVSERAVCAIANRKLLKENGVIVVERDKPVSAPRGLAVRDVRKYGKAFLTFIKEERACLFAGTFDPVTLGHRAVVNAALERYDRVYVTVMKNESKVPFFSLEDRLNMLALAFGKDERVTIDRHEGMLVDYMKEKGLVYNVRGCRSDKDMEYEKTMETYNKTLFPEMVYDYIFTDMPVSSSEVRARIAAGEDTEELVGEEVSEYIRKIQAQKAQDE